MHKHLQLSLTGSFLLLLFFFPLKAEKPSYLQATVQAGDGIYALLRRYKLDKHSCNFSKFYDLNGLDKNAHLRIGKAYFLPVMIVDFDGSTIRSSIGLDDWDLAVSIQKYNEDMLADGLRNRSYQDSRQLWVPHHITSCGTADLKIKAPEPILNEDFTDVSNPGGRNFPIFGDKYAKTPMLSNRLAGKIFYIVSGHGGPDPGAMGRRANINLCEDEYAYDVALRLCRKLIENGATAYMITRDENDGIRDDQYLKCDTDETVWGGAKILRGHKARLFQRSNVINELYEKNKSLGFKEQAVIVIHVDSRAKGEQTDLFFYYQDGMAESKDLAQKLHQKMKDKYKKYRRNGEYHGTVKTRDLHMLREVIPNTVYIELANIRNSFDQQRIVVTTNRDALAKWLYEGLLMKY